MTTYRYDDGWHVQEFDCKEDFLDYVFDEDAYDEMLDECYPDYEIGDLSYTASQVLKEVDPVAYDIGRDEYVDSLSRDYTDGDLVDMYPGLEVIEDEDEDEEEE